MNDSLESSKTSDAINAIRKEHLDVLKRQELQTKSWQLKTEELTHLHQKAIQDYTESNNKNKQLQSELDKHNSNSSKLKEFRNEMDTMELDHYESTKNLESKIKSLQQLSNESINSNKELRFNLTEIEKEKLALQTSLSALSLHEQNDSSTHDIAQLKKDHLESQKWAEIQIKTLKMKSEETQRSNLQLKNDIIEIEKNNSVLQNSLDEYDAHVTHIEAQYASLQNENVVLKKGLEAKSKMLRDATGNSTSSSLT